MTAIVDYGVGNLFSLKSSFASIGEEAVVTDDRKVLMAADRIVLPGVGAFGDAVQKLRERDLFDFVKSLAATGKPFLGICLGMQLLFDRSYEYGEHEGLGLVPGEVRPIEGVIPENLDIPHMGWNGLHFYDHGEGISPIFRDLKEGEHVYFVHSFAAFNCAQHLTASAEYGAELTAAVQNGNVFGTQFHPEKSGETGMKILRAFVKL